MGKAGYPFVEADYSFSRAIQIGRAYCSLFRRRGFEEKLALGPSTFFGEVGHFRIDGNARGISALRERMHLVLRCTLLADQNCIRAEVIPKVPCFREQMFAPYRSALRYEFEVRLPYDNLSTPDSMCIAQWHGISNRLIGDGEQHAPFLLGIEDGRYFCVNIASQQLIQKKVNPVDPFRLYDKVKRVDLGAATPDWTKWAFEVVWSFTQGVGRWRLFRDDRLVADDIGANCLNDLRGGPYLKLGTYRLPREGAAEPVARTTITQDYRKIRISSGAERTIPTARCVAHVHQPPAQR